MRALLVLSLCLALVLPVAALAGTYTLSPSEPESLWVWWHACGPMDTIRLLPGTYDLSWPWPLQLSSDSPCLVGADGPEGVILLGSGVERAFVLPEFMYDAHICVERITFRGLAEIIGRVDAIDSSSGELHFTDNIVDDCGTGSSYFALKTTACWGTIARNTFCNNHGPAIVNYHTTASIEDNEICGNSQGIADMCCQSPAMRRNHVHDNAGTGIQTGYNDGGIIEYNVIEHNGGTGLVLGSHFTVQHNVIRENARGVSSGSWVGNWSAIHYNDIYDNTGYNLRAEHPWAQMTLDCTMNWWGSVDPLAIADGIVDCYDDPELLACVMFEPFCTSPGCEVTAVEASSWGRIKALYRR